MQIHHRSRDIVDLTLFHGYENVFSRSSAFNSYFVKNLDLTSKVFREHESYLLWKWHKVSNKTCNMINY